MDFDKFCKSKRTPTKELLIAAITIIMTKKKNKGKKHRQIFNALVKMVADAKKCCKEQRGPTKAELVTI